MKIVANRVFQDYFNSFYPCIRTRAVNFRGRNSGSPLTLTDSISSVYSHEPLMAKPKFNPNQNLIPFPDAEASERRRSEHGPRGSSVAEPIFSAVAPQITDAKAIPSQIVISGSYRKGVEALKRAYEEFKDLGYQILSPSNISIVSEIDGFVYMKGEETETPARIEDRHLEAIQRSNFVWLHAPDGYVGPTAALEVGYANAIGVPVYAQQMPTDKILQSFVRLAPSPLAMRNVGSNHPEPPAPALKAFQEYYKRAALQRGYTNEGPKECLLLMVEEVGELARALRKREKLVRHGSYHDANEAQELADVFLYVIHMANVLGFDLSDAVRNKEFKNIEKFLAR